MISDRLNCAEIEESSAAIRGWNEGRPDWRRAGRDFPRIARESRPNNCELTGSSICDLIAAKTSLFEAVQTDWFAIWLRALTVGKSVHVRARQRGS